MSKFIANEKRQYAKEIYQDFNFETYYNGATYVPFEAVIQMQ